MESGLVKNIDITKCKIKLKKNLIKLGLNETPFLFNTKTSVWIVGEHTYAAECDDHIAPKRSASLGERLLLQASGQLKI